MKKAIINTSKGKMEVEFYEKDAPKLGEDTLEIKNKLNDSFFWEEK